MCVLLNADGWFRLKIFFINKTITMFTFRKNYFFGFLILLLVEIYIAIYVHDSFIRPFFGDFLVVILLYCLLRSFLKIDWLWVAIGVLIFSFVLEVMQYFKLVNMLGLQDVKLARIVIGTSFAWEDLVAYTLGIWTVVFIERKWNPRNVL